MTVHSILRKKLFVSVLNTTVITLCLVCGSTSYAESNETIIDLWADVTTPDRVELQGI